MREPADLSVDEIEVIEKASLRVLFIAAKSFGFDAWEVFRQSSDDPKDVAEDVTREMLDRLGGYGVQQRIFGNVDYRKARYIILPEYSVRQAFLVDSKAEKSASSATLQMSQVSMRVRQLSGGKEIDMPGKIEVQQTYGQKAYLSTVLLAHYHYSGESNGSGKDAPPYRLSKLTLAAIPNGRLQERYNASPDNTIWRVGRHATSLNEDFRVRLSFASLKSKAAWRVQSIKYDPANNDILAEWTD